MTILKAIEFLHTQKWVDLSHGVNTTIPYFPAFKPIEEKTLFTVEKDGFLAKEYTVASQYGTHIDAPVHFADGKRTLDEIGATEFILPLIVIHKEKEVATNPDYRLTVEDIQQFEAEFGKIPSGSFVAFASGWSARWKDIVAFYNKDENGQAHTPGWSLEALQFLHNERDVAAIGHETLDTDSALDFVKNQDLVGERYWLSQNKFQVEVLNNLSSLPSVGGAIFIGVPKIEQAPGFNARVLAVVPA
ncbi:cyclase family protein [Mannheimia granulomatis]|uniref:cyclase family protein n=1 Tax=Mannheimia granulomatis TaxID=85402 RepID=UPI000ACA4446|nr:cyclase family protein [Mannheimia granulomatis]